MQGLESIQGGVVQWLGFFERRGRSLTQGLQAARHRDIDGVQLPAPIRKGAADAGPELAQFGGVGRCRNCQLQTLSINLANAARPGKYGRQYLGKCLLKL